MLILLVLDLNQWNYRKSFFFQTKHKTTMIRVMVFESRHEKQSDKDWLLMLTDSSRDWADLKRIYPVLMNYTWINDFQSSEMFFPKQLLNTLYPTDKLTRQLADSATKVINEQTEKIKQLEKDAEIAQTLFKDATDKLEEIIAEKNGEIKDLITMKDENTQIIVNLSKDIESLKRECDRLQPNKVNADLTQTKQPKKQKA